MILTEEQEMIRDAAREFSQAGLVPHAPKWDRTGEFPEAAISRMGELGFLGMLIPEDWDGADTGHIAYALALEEVAAGDGGCSTVMSVQNSVVNIPILREGSTAQKERFLRPLARGEMRGGFALTEPQAGSDASSLKVQARFDGNRYILSGTKQFITSGETADVMLTFAVTDPDAGKKSISAFLVPTDQPGYRVARKEEKLGQRSSDTCQIVFEDMEITPDLMLGEPGEGYRIALSNLEGGRIGIAAQSVGMARAAYEAARDYAGERESFGRAIAGHQAVAFRLADMATQIEAAHQMVLHAAALRDVARSCLKEASMAKLFASEMAETVCSQAIQIHGGYGYLSDYPVERIYRDVRVCQIYEGTSDVQRMVISPAISGD